MSSRPRASTTRPHDLHHHDDATVDHHDDVEGDVAVVLAAAALNTA